MVDSAHCVHLVCLVLSDHAVSWVFLGEREWVVLFIGIELSFPATVQLHRYVTDAQVPVADPEKQPVSPACAPGKAGEDANVADLASEQSLTVSEYGTG